MGSFATDRSSLGRVFFRAPFEPSIAPRDTHSGKSADGDMALVLLAHSFFLQRDAKQLARQKPYPPLTTLLTAAILREAGHEVAFFDATFEPGPDAFERRIAGMPASTLILIEDNFNFLTKMCTETRRADALAMIGAARERGWRVAVNSPDSADNPRLYLDAGADAVLTGEGEFGADDFVRGGSGAAGLIRIGADGELQHSPRPRTRPDLDALPLPAWDLADIAAYRAVWTAAHGHFSLNIAASRGCPYTCNWCAKPTFGRRYDQRSPSSVADEMRQIKERYDPDHLWFADDIFGMSENWLRDFADEVERRDAAIPFMMQSRVNLISVPVADALRRAGAQEVWLGVESGSQRVLDAMDKSARVEAARAATRNLKRHGIRACWFLQLGYPPEDWHDILLTRNLVREEAPDEIGVSVAYPLPGTVFHERQVAELGPQRNWRDTDELAMLFRGTFDTAFYRDVRDALHAEAPSGKTDDARWLALGLRADAHRQERPRLRA
jgi:anaerobic magnesium-protoporphyrin IX monomethyl ester cyclase